MECECRKREYRDEREDECSQPAARSSRRRPKSAAIGIASFPGSDDQLRVLGTDGLGFVGSPGLNRRLLDRCVLFFNGRMRGFLSQNSQHVVPAARNGFLELDLAVRTEFQRSRASPVPFFGLASKRVARCAFGCSGRVRRLQRQAILIGHFLGCLHRIRVGRAGRTGSSGAAHSTGMIPQAHRQFGIGRDTSGVHAALCELIACLMSARLGEISYTHGFVASREQIEFATRDGRHLLASQ